MGDSRIFISYRRDDSAGYAGRIYDRLRALFPDTQIFMDVDTIGLGVDFAQEIDKAVGKCDVLLAIIGPRWLDALDDEGRRRLDNPDDYVRLEIGTALERNIYVIPVLVEGSTLPQLAELPSTLKGLRKTKIISRKY